MTTCSYDEQGDTLYVNDPGFNRQSYSYKSDVVGWRLYNMTKSTTDISTFAISQ
jgi:hypothetical protein